MSNAVSVINTKKRTRNSDLNWQVKLKGAWN